MPQLDFFPSTIKSFCLYEEKLLFEVDSLSQMVTTKSSLEKTNNKKSLE